MGLLDKRIAYSPFEYPQAYEYWLKQQQAHWLHTEVSLATDIHDFKTKLTDAEKNVISLVLKGFTQSEVIINDYWARRVFKWFPKPEVSSMASVFGSMESIHAKAYAYLNESLGIDFDYQNEPATKNRIDRLINMKVKNKKDIGRSLAVFSGFAEGVQLYSSFAILMSFSRRNLLKGIGQIVAFSIKDESLHSEAGCWLFRQLCSEYPEILSKHVHNTIIKAARDTVELEDKFIDKVFEKGAIEGLDPNDLKNYIKMRTNTKLKDLGLGYNWKNMNLESANKIADWFDHISRGVEHQDFFAGRVTTYSKGIVDFTKAFE